MRKPTIDKGLLGTAQCKPFGISVARSPRANCPLACLTPSPERDKRYKGCRDRQGTQRPNGEETSVEIEVPRHESIFGQAPSIHRRSTFIGYQFAAYAYADCQSLDLLPWPDAVLVTQRVAIRPHTLGLLQAISYFLFLFFNSWEQERRLYSSRSIAKK